MLRWLKLAVALGTLLGYLLIPNFPTILAVVFWIILAEINTDVNLQRKK